MTGLSLDENAHPLAADVGSARRAVRLRAAGDALGTGLLAAVGAGAVAGVVARMLMRAVVLASGRSGSFSWSGSVGICVIFAAFMLPGAVFALLRRGRGRWALLALGAAALCVPATGVAVAEVHTGSLSGMQWAGVLGAGAAVYACVLATPVLTLAVLDRLLRRRTGGPRHGARSIAAPAERHADRRPSRLVESGRTGHRDGQVTEQ